MSDSAVQFDQDMRSAFKDLFNEVRAILLSIDQMVETKKPRITTYSDKNGGICHLRTTATGVDMGYLKGASFDDKHHLLTGTSKKMRVHRLPADQPLNEVAVRFYLEQARRLNLKS